MAKIYKCVFCGKGYPPARGLMYVKNDGTIMYFCSSKCRKSVLNLGRDSRRLKWTVFYGKKERGR